MKKMSYVFCLSFVYLLFLTILFEQPSKAEVINPSRISPGAVTQHEIQRNQRIEENVKQKNLEEEYLKENDSIKLAPEGQEAAEDKSGLPQFTIKDVQINGNRKVSTEKLKKPFNNILDRSINFDDLQEAIDEANEIYAKEGYITSKLNIPPQELGQDGILKINAIESRIGDIKVSNDGRMNKNYIRNQIRPTRGHVFNLKQLEESLSRLNRRGHVRVIAKVVPGQKENTSDLMIDVSEVANLVQVVPQVNNQGRSLVGLLRGGASVVSRSPLGIGDNLSIYGVGARKTAIGGASYRVPVNSHGTYLGTSYDYGNVFPKFQGLKLTGKSHIFSAYAGQELVNKDNLQINAELGFQVKEPQTKLAGIKIVDTPIRNIFQRVTFNQVDKHGATYGYLQANEGFSALGGKSEFFTLNGEVNRMQKFFDLKDLFRSDKVYTQPSYFLARTGGQISSRPLPAIEQYQVGGIYTVRGYQEGSLINDIGQFASLEYHFPLPMPTDRWNLDKRFELVGFIDEGAVKPYRGGWQSQNFLLGTGAGIRARLTELVSVQLDVGFPLTNKINSGSPADARAHFSVFFASPSFSSPWKKASRQNLRKASKKPKVKVANVGSLGQYLAVTGKTPATSLLSSTSGLPSFK
jgi:hemolysin activation/secretion protein